MKVKAWKCLTVYSTGKSDCDYWILSRVNSASNGGIQQTLVIVVHMTSPCFVEHLSTKRRQGQDTPVSGAGSGVYRLFSKVLLKCLILLYKSAAPLMLCPQQNPQHVPCCYYRGHNSNPSIHGKQLRWLEQQCPQNWVHCSHQSCSTRTRLQTDTVLDSLGTLGQGTLGRGGHSCWFAGRTFHQKSMSLLKVK